MKTVINVKADKEVKRNAKKIAEELGLSLSAIVNAQLKQFVRDREVYFSAKRRMTPRLEKLVKAARNDYKRNKNISPVFSSAEKMDAYLDDL